MNVTKQDIIDGLHRLGVKPGMVLLVHSSLRSFGYVEGGADTVIDALLETVGPEGTIAVPTLTINAFNEKDPCFDVRSCPSETGRITEVLRHRSNAIRSLHPISSMTAIGAQAEFLTRNHVGIPCSKESSYGRIYQLGGASLFLGATLDSNTMFHVAEDIADPPYLIYREFHDVKIIDQQGQESFMSFRRYDCNWQGRFRYLARMEPIFIEKGVLHETQIGNARCMLLHAKDNIEISVELLKTNPSYIL